MMRIITKEQLQNKINELLKDFEIIGPEDVPNKGIFYQSISKAEDLCLSDGFAIEPVKKFFLEPSSWILRHSYNNEYSTETIPQPDKKRIIIGARPCEARGLVLLDKIFDSDYKDRED